MAVILEARRSVGFYPTPAEMTLEGQQNIMMPLEMELMVFGAKFHTFAQRDVTRNVILKIWN